MVDLVLGLFFVKVSNDHENQGAGDLKLLGGKITSAFKEAEFNCQSRRLSVLLRLVWTRVLSPHMSYCGI